MAQAQPQDPHAEPVGAGVVPFAVGLWLLAAPWVLGFESEGAAWNAIAAGFTIAFLSFVRASGGAASAVPGVLTLVVGGWLLLSALLLESSRAAALNAVVCGGIVVLLAVWAQTGAGRSRRDQAKRTGA